MLKNITKISRKCYTLVTGKFNHKDTKGAHRGHYAYVLKPAFASVSLPLHTERLWRAKTKFKRIFHFNKSKIYDSAFFALS
jgi:hypothetical protein